MRSRYADYFNHDDDAQDYDADVMREEDPIRAGYAALLAWVGSRIAPSSRVLDLGSGTGNTVLELPPTCDATMVDVSEKMMEIARSKLGDRAATCVVADILEFVEGTDLRDFDFVVSTYALHHLTPDERTRLFGSLRSALRRDARIVVGDLMYRNENDCERIVNKFASSSPQLAAAVAEEFFWDIERTTEMFQRLDWAPSWRSFSDLSWAVELESR